MRRLSFLIYLFVVVIPVLAQSPHGKKLTIDCSECHVPASWKIEKDKIKFDHSTTVFALAGQHQNVDCKKCHTTLVFSNSRTECNSCHKDIHKNSVGVECQRCHTSQSWIVTNALPLHQNTHFPLVGVHAQAECVSCHADYGVLNFRTAGVNCYDCHVTNFNSTTNPNHVAAGFSRECQDCHKVTATSWSQGTYVSHNFFPLEQGHRIECFSCHRKDTFKGLSRDCYACHRQNYEATKIPDHKKLNFSTQCQSCHSIAGWKQAVFDHNTTGFVLAGAHKTVDCAGCHTAGTDNTPTICSGCHMADINKPVNPNHKLVNFPKVCDQCHSVNGWKPASFNHASTNFPLTGQHVTITCNQCHVTQYAGTAKDCYTCHLNDNGVSTNPKHNLGNFPKPCEQCHTTNGWKPSSFNHASTNFQLTGQHVALTCNQCHVTQYAGTAKDCYSCHLNDNGISTNPKHNLGNFPKPCEQCHTTNGWKPTQFNHSMTNYPLTGKHQTVLCNNCHIAAYAGTSTVCKNCHQSDISKPVNPLHTLGNFPQTCEQCHTPSAWIPSSFNHASTNFQLVGKHLTVSCNSCHVVQYSGTAKDCYQCHLSDYNGAQNPNHKTGGYPTDCSMCHSSIAWIPSSFNHAATGFALTGKHATITCADCHGGTIAHLDPTCSVCHKADISVSKVVNHNLGNFLTGKTCDMCHSTTIWKPSSFTHAATAFPLTGTHTSTSCNSCHTANYAGTAKDCYTCHSSNYKSSVNPPHASPALSAIFVTTCSNCHSTNLWRPTTWSHKQYYDITVKHSSRLCSDCHTSWANPAAPQCISCHQSDFSKEHNSSHSKDCWKSGCHTNPSSFNR